MTIAPFRTGTSAALAIVLLSLPVVAEAQRGGHDGFGGGHGGFGGGHGFGEGHHGHPINAWTGSHRPKLR